MSVATAKRRDESKDAQMHSMQRMPPARLWAGDPLGFNAGDTNLYRYVGNDPTDEVDPSGLQAQPQKTTLQDLENFLSNIANSEAAKDEAKKIAAAIKNTFDNNSSITFPRLQDERNKGYFCYDWAYGFEDAFKLEASGKYFKAKVEGATTTNGDGRVHFWLRIESLETGKTVFVDDGFMNNSYVHDKRPVAGLYKYDPMVPSDQPRNKSDPPTAYYANGKSSRPPETRVIGTNAYGGPAFRTENPKWYHYIFNALANLGSGGSN